METEKGLFFVYLRERGKAIACLCLFTGIFAGTFLLYHVPWQAAAYPAALCLGLGVLLLLRDYRRFRRVHEAYRRLTQLPELTREQLPQGKSQTERDCAALLEKQLEDMARLQTASADRFTTQTDYFSAWAHQIKTPIAAMGLKLQNEDSPLARGLRGDLNRIAQYVEMAMTYLRLDAETGDYVLKTQELDPIIRGAVRRFAGEFIDRKLRLRLQETGQMVLTDEKWLSFVLEQLLSNALKYTPGGEISIFWQEPDTLVIRDTGIGIAPEDLPRIFEKGYTGLNGRQVRKTTGIGLYLCHEILSRLGHQITIRSAPGQGTTVLLDLRRDTLEIE